MSRDDVSPSARTCGGPVRQDEDVLDTWFSSWLWPISTLGWPDERRAGPEGVLPDRRARDRAGDPVLLGGAHDHGRLRVHGRAPFHTVYLHGTVRDTQHRKMSKSLGNGIDPLDVVRLYGADALR